MATPVTICNLALSRIGDSATVSSIDPPDGSAQADACSRFYPIALASCLDSFNWSFATRRSALAELAEGTVELGPWKHAYALPAACHRVIEIAGVLPPAHCVRHEKHDFEVVGMSSGRAILTNLDEPTLTFITSEPLPAQFTGLFTDALAWLLASYLTGETIRGDSAFAYTQKCQQQFQIALSTAMKQDARQVHTTPRHVAPWIAGR